MNYEPLSIDADTLSSAKENLNAMLLGIMDRMLREGFDEGTVTVKINIELVNKEVMIEDRTEMMKVPYFENKVSGGVKRSFKMGGTDGGDSVINIDDGDFKLIRILNGQLSMFDEEEE